MWYNKELVVTVPPPLGYSHLQNENLQPVITYNFGTEKKLVVAKELKVHMLNLKLKLTKILDLQAYLYKNDPTLLPQLKK